MRSEADIQACAEMFLQSYLNFYSKPDTRPELRVHLVCKEDKVHSCVTKVLDDYVQSKKKVMEESYEDNSGSPTSGTDNSKPENIVTVVNIILVILLNTSIVIR